MSRRKEAQQVVGLLMYCGSRSDGAGSLCDRGCHRLHGRQRPLAGTARRLDRIVLSDDPVAADATSARMMGLVPERVPHIEETAKFLGNAAPERIDQLGALVAPPPAPFQTVQEFEDLRAQAGPRSAAPR